MVIADDLAPLRVPIDSLHQLPGNPRRGDVDAVAASLARFGQRKPIVVADDGTIIAGNHTWAAAKQLGWDEIAVVRVGDDEATAQAFALADNRTAELGGYDEAALLDLIRQVADVDASLLADTGWDDASVQDLADRIDPGLPDTPPDDDAPPPPAEPLSRPGDVWVLGAHRLVVGDATDVGAYEALLGDDLADCVITDPPYGVAYVGKTADALTIANDNLDLDGFRDFLLAAYSSMYAASRAGAPIYVFHADTFGEVFRRAHVEGGWLLKQVLVWVKNSMVLGRQDYNWQHEPILYGWKPGAGHTWVGSAKSVTVLQESIDNLGNLTRDELLDMLTTMFEQSTAIRANRPSRNRQHPTMKPVHLIQRLLANSAERRSIVLDPFGGSGSTLMACEYTGRRARLIELDPKYADVICRRWQEYTGAKPVLEATGEPHDFTEERDDDAAESA